MLKLNESQVVALSNELRRRVDALRPSLLQRVEAARAKIDDITLEQLCSETPEIGALVYEWIIRDGADPHDFATKKLAELVYEDIPYDFYSEDIQHGGFEVSGHIYENVLVKEKDQYPALKAHMNSCQEFRSTSAMITAHLSTVLKGCMGGLDLRFKLSDRKDRLKLGLMGYGELLKVLDTNAPKKKGLFW